MFVEFMDIGGHKQYEMSRSVYYDNIAGGCRLVADLCPGFPPLAGGLVRARRGQRSSALCAMA